MRHLRNYLQSQITAHEGNRKTFLISSNRGIFTHIKLIGDVISGIQTRWYVCEYATGYSIGMLRPLFLTVKIKFTTNIPVDNSGRALYCDVAMRYRNASTAFIRVLFDFDTARRFLNIPWDEVILFRKTLKLA